MLLLLYIYVCVCMPLHIYLYLHIDIDDDIDIDIFFFIPSLVHEHWGWPLHLFSQNLYVRRLPHTSNESLRPK